MDVATLTELENKVTQIFANCDDFLIRKINAGNTAVMFCFFKGITQRDYISEKLIKPFLVHADMLNSFSGNFETILQSSTVKYPPDINEVVDGILRGEVLIAVEKDGTLYTVMTNCQVSVGRSIDEPTSDITVKGPKAGFIEDAETNMAQLRRYIKNSSLKFESVNIGNLTDTKVVIAYMEGRANPNVIENIKTKIKNADATAIVDSANINTLIDKRKFPFFPIMGSSEKVDKVASKILAGRVAIIVDGSPFVLTAPYVFAESIQSSEDYYRSTFYATFIRCLRFTALMVALYLPGLLVTLITSYNELIPQSLYESIQKMRADMPYSMFWEVVFVLIMFEMLREVGVRMPRSVGDAIGIVGSLILGDAAISARLASPIVIVAIALAAVCAFIVPVYMYSTVLLRILFLFLGFKLGFYGIILGTLMLLFLLCRTDSFGSSYMTPLAPFDKTGLEDFLIASPKKTLGRKEQL
ncbi:MAG TPA: spore germination protein [Bacillota bacterium]|nr:spore germination protein [Bacillota bacterium]